MKAARAAALLFVLVVAVSPAAANEDGDVNVEVSGTCDLYSPIFNPPALDSFAFNNDTEVRLNVIAKNQSDSFYYTIVNGANRDANLTHEIDLRKIDQYQDDWEQGEDRSLEGQNVSYAPKNDTLYSTIPENETTALGNTFLARFMAFTAIYQPGNYIARLEANYTCRDSGNKTMTRYTRFRIVDAPGSGGGVEQGDFPSDDPYPAQSNVTTNESSNYTSPDTGGNQTSQLERPRNANQTGNYTTNTTVPADANRTGETSNQTVPQDVNQTGEEGPPNPGDSDDPGKTPEPEPEPVPEPGDSPTPGQSDTPEINIDIEPTNSTYSGEQGAFSPAELQVQNIGDATVTDIDLVPEIADVRPGWQVRNATVSNLSVNETVERDVFVRPPQDQPAGEYLVPVRAENQQGQLDLDYFTFDVKLSEFQSRVDIEEAPRTVSIQEGENQTLPILVSNPGRRNITNVTARLQNAEDCGTVSGSTVSFIDVNESASMDLQIQANQNSQSCEATLIVSTANGGYSFSDMNIEIRPEEGLIPQEQQVPFIAIAWTFVLLAYSIIRKRYELDTSLVKIPFFLLLMGETVIILYMLVNYYGVISLSFLPF